MSTTTYLKGLLLFVTCLFFLSCSSSSTPSQKLVKLQFGDAVVFQTPGGLAVPLDLNAIDQRTSFDAQTSTNAGTAEMKGVTRETGHPYFLCSCNVSTIKVNGALVSFTSYPDPDRQNTLVIVEKLIQRGAPTIIEVTFTMNSTEVSFQNGGVGFLISMSDLQDGSFFEKYGPTNFESDQYSLNWTLEVKNSTSVHQIFTNGKVSLSSQVGSTQSWLIEFPSHFTSSSPFLHLTNRSDLFIERFNVTGSEKVIPVIVYSANQSLTNQAVAQLPNLFAELEEDFGPYAHDSFIAYMTSGGGGMEYVGSTITSLGALDHELTHSWFARGVMPSDGRSGWIDEAVASWRDYGYSRASSYGQRDATNLANFSPFERFTPRNCYRDGRHLLSELDYILAEQGGLKPVLKSFFAKFKLKTVTTQNFIDHLEAQATINLRPLLTHNLFGDYLVQEGALGEHSVGGHEANDSRHPAPLSIADQLRLR